MKIFPASKRDVKLTDSEILTCEVIAKLRYDNNRNKNVRNSKLGSQDNIYTDLEGLCGELAFCKFFNLYTDLSVGIRSSNNGEDMGDCVLEGKTIDVKVTKYSKGKLLAPSWKSNTVDYYALMVGEKGKYTFKGFMESSELLKSSRLGSLGYGETYIAEQHELTGGLL